MEERVCVPVTVLSIINAISVLEKLINRRMHVIKVLSLNYFQIQREKYK